MSKEFYQQFLFCFSLASAISIWIIHKYLKRTLRKNHDKGYWYMALSFAFWSIMALIELFEAGENSRILCSAFNNASLIMSFSFIDHGWKRLSSAIQKVGWIGIASSLFILTLIVGALDRDNGHWFARIDATLSIIILGALATGLAVTFPKRGMFLMSIFSVIAGVLTMLTQYYILVDKKHLDTSYFYALLKSNNLGDLMRILSLPILLICILALALSFLGLWVSIGKVNNQEKTKEKTDSPPILTPSSEDSKGNPLEKGMQVEVTKRFKEKYNVSDEDLNILRRLAEGATMAEIAKDIPRYKLEKGNKKLQNEVIRRLANSFGLSHERSLAVVVYAIQQGAIDVKSLKIALNTKN